MNLLWQFRCELITTHYKISPANHETILKIDVFDVVSGGKL